MEKIKILIVSQDQLTNETGAAKVHYQMKEEYKRLGHAVDTLDIRDLYPNGYNSFWRIFGKFYTYRIWKYLKKHAHKYDVIDANFECIVYPKNSYGFNGIVMARSHGIRPIYDLAEKIEGYQRALMAEKQNVSIKTRFGNVYRYFLKKSPPSSFFASLEYSDIIHSLNRSELDYFLGLGVPKEKLVLIPNGLPESDISAFGSRSIINAKAETLCFVGSWTIRKGIKDLDKIIYSISQKRTKLEKVLLLGGYSKISTVLKDFKTVDVGKLSVVPSYKAEQLQNYLANCKVGIFPSYVEGFPFAIVEQLACGIPVVAYKVPGSTDILNGLDPSLLVEPGDTDAFASRVCGLLEMKDEDFLILSNRCKQESRKYFLGNIAEVFVSEFSKRCGSSVECRIGVQGGGALAHDFSDSQ